MTDRLTESPPIPEARPPHLPDVLTRLSPGVYAFGLMALINLWFRVRQWSGNFPILDADSVLLLVPALIPAIATPLLGVALFLRHPRAHREMPLLVFGLALMAAGELLGTFSSQIRVFLSELQPNEFALTSPAQVAFTVFTMLLSIFALLYVGAGLSVARSRERVPAERPLLIWLVALAVVSIVLSVAGVVQVLPSTVDMGMELVVQLVLGSVLSAVLTLAWTYLTVMAIGGWLAGEGPRRAWGLAALALLILFVLRLVGSVVTVIAVPDAFEIYSPVAVVGLSAAWLLLLVAFLLGLPKDRAMADPPAVMPTGSAGG